MAKHRTGHLFKRGSTFYVSWRVNGQVFSKALRDDSGQPVTTKREAEEARRKVMAPFAVADEAAALESIVGKLEGRKAELAKLEDQQNPPLPIIRAWTEFLASPNRPDSGESTLYQYECQFAAFADWMKERHAEAPALLRDVTKEVAEDYAASLNGGRLSPNTCNKHLNLLTLVFRVLKDKAKLTSNPWEDIQRKRIVTHSRRELTVDELKKLCQAATGELRALLALGVYSGLRLGDCATLRWAEVDLPRAMIRRIPNKTARRNPKPVIVPIHPSLRDMLAETPTLQRREYVLPEIAALYNNRSDLVTDMVQAHFKKCGITPHKPGTGKDGKRAVVEVGFHSLRHTFVSLCRESNAPLAVVESIVGHSNPAMTRHYTHVGELAAGRAVAALPSVLGDATPEPTQREEGAILRELKAIAQSITAANWEAQKAALLALLEPSNGVGQNAATAPN
ncbi:MAG: site-specific integrase [Verrucomicrobia bacterium]|nr:site-specific integrase [Verrucomicrobiota bacterium]